MRKRWCSAISCFGRELAKPTLKFKPCDWMPLSFHSSPFKSEASKCCSRFLFLFLGHLLCPRGLQSISQVREHIEQGIHQVGQLCSIPGNTLCTHTGEASLSQHACPVGSLCILTFSHKNIMSSSVTGSEYCSSLSTMIWSFPSRWTNRTNPCLPKNVLTLS